MSLARINRLIAARQKYVELVRGDGYHYYVFDTATPEDSRRAVPACH